MDNAQCQVPCAIEFRPRGSSSPVSPAPSRCKRWFCSCGRAPENFVRVPGLSFLYNLGEPIWKVLYSWDFQSPSYVLQSALQLPRFRRGPFRRNNPKLLDGFLFTPTLLNARVKVCYCKKWNLCVEPDGPGCSGRSELSAKCETFKLTVLNIANPLRCQGRSLHTKVNLRACNFKHCYPNYEGWTKFYPGLCTWLQDFHAVFGDATLSDVPWIIYTFEFPFIRIVAR